MMTKFGCHYDPAAATKSGHFVAGEVIPAYKEIPKDGWSGGTGVRSPARIELPRNGLILIKILGDCHIPDFCQEFAMTGIILSLRSMDAEAIPLSKDLPMEGQEVTILVRSPACCRQGMTIKSFYRIKVNNYIKYS